MKYHLYMGVLEIISNAVSENILYSAGPPDWFLSTHWVSLVPAAAYVITTLRFNINYSLAFLLRLLIN